MLAAREPADTDIVVSQVRSAIGSKPKHRSTLRALGLGRIGKSRRLPDRPEIRGMIARVPHLVSVTAAADSRTLVDNAHPEPIIHQSSPSEHVSSPQEAKK